MSLREFLRTRRQRKARKGYEREKAQRQNQNDDAMERVAAAADKLGGMGGSGLG